MEIQKIKRLNYNRQAENHSRWYGVEISLKLVLNRKRERRTLLKRNHKKMDQNKRHSRIPKHHNTKIKRQLKVEQKTWITQFQTQQKNPDKNTANKLVDWINSYRKHRISDKTEKINAKTKLKKLRRNTGSKFVL